jgi:hypothetical protein
LEFSSQIVSLFLQPKGFNVAVFLSEENQAIFRTLKLKTITERLWRAPLAKLEAELVWRKKTKNIESLRAFERAL